MTTVGHTTDRSRPSVSQDVGRKLGASDAATAMQVETRDPKQEARVAKLLTAPTPDLYAACTEQVERLARWDADPASLTEQESKAEMDRWDALCKRVATVPANNVRDLAGKAHLIQADIDRFYPLKEYGTTDWLMMRALVRDAIAFGGSASPVSNGLTGDDGEAA